MQAIYQTRAEAVYDHGMQTGRPSKRQRPAFGARLHMLREQAGLSQQQMAVKLSIPQRTYAYWEREPVALRAEQITALTDALNVTADFLLGREEPKTRGTGPVGKTRRVFDKLSKLPRHHQQRIVGVVEALVAQSSTEK